MATTTLTTRIEIDGRGRAWLPETRTKVIEVVMDHLNHGWSVEQMHAEHPHLTLAQLYTAMAFYYENQAELDQQISQDEIEASGLAERLADKKLQKNLRLASHNL